MYSQSPSIFLDKFQEVMHNVDETAKKDRDWYQKGPDTTYKAQLERHLSCSTLFRIETVLIFFTIYNLFKNRSCSQEAELQRLNFTKEKFKLIILSITD
jgi:hypothetical protein